MVFAPAALRGRLREPAVPPRPQSVPGRSGVEGDRTDTDLGRPSAGKKSSPAEFAKFLASDTEKLARVIRTVCQSEQLVSMANPGPKWPTRIGTAGPLDRVAQIAERKYCRPQSTTGTSPRASVSDTRVWQFAVLPSADAYCGATLPNACLSWVSQYRRSPARHRCRRRACLLGQVVRFPYPARP